jgi:regulator of RNase E activity RraA
MRTGKDRVQVDATQIPVALGDVRVVPGDIVVGDKDGIVVVPANRADEVFQKALTTREAEEKILNSVLAGDSLADARKKHRYHTLQRGGE